MGELITTSEGFLIKKVLEVDDAIPGDSVKTFCIPNLLSLKHEDVPFLSLPSNSGPHKFEYDTLGLEATCPDNKGWRLPHGSDIERIQILMKYGGIWFDNDVYVVQNLNYYRRFEMALAWDENQFLGTQVLVAHKNARFLKLWLDTYREYYPERWYYNAGERPTVEVLYKDPSLVHRVKLKFGAHMLVPQLYHSYWREWKEQITIHLLFNHRYYLDKENYQKYGGFDETTIMSYNQTFGFMAREILPRKYISFLKN